MSIGNCVRNLFITAFTACSAGLFAQDAGTVKEVKIGDQVWMAENVNVNIPNSFAYKSDPVNVKLYGRLYTWDAAQKACPKGWHLPTDVEWTQLTTFLGCLSLAASKLKANGASGFNALMAGLKNEKGEFDEKNTNAIFWSSTPFQGNTAWAREIKSFSPLLIETSYDKNVAASCRCIKDK